MITEYEIKCRGCGQPDEKNTYSFGYCQKCVKEFISNNTPIPGTSIHAPLSSNGRKALSEGDNGGSSPSEGTIKMYKGSVQVITPSSVTTATIPFLTSLGDKGWQFSL